MNRLAPLASIGAPNNNNQPTLDDTSISNETTTVSLLKLNGLHNIVPYLTFGEKSTLSCTNWQLNKLILEEDEHFTFARQCFNFKVVDENGYDNLLRKISLSNLSSLEVIKTLYSSSMLGGLVIDGILELIHPDDSSVESDCAVAHGYTDKSATVLIKSSGIPLDSLINGNVDSIGKKRRKLAAYKVAKRIKSSEDDSTKSMDIGDLGNVSNASNPTSSGVAAAAAVDWDVNNASNPTSEQDELQQHHFGFGKGVVGDSPSDVGENLSTTQDELQSHYFGNGDGAVGGSTSDVGWDLSDGAAVAAPISDSGGVDLSTCVKEGKAAAAASYFQSDKGVERDFSDLGFGKPSNPNRTNSGGAAVEKQEDEPEPRRSLRLAAPANTEEVVAEFDNEKQLQVQAQERRRKKKAVVVVVQQSIATWKDEGHLNKPPKPMSMELVFRPSDVRKTEESRCATVAVRSRKGHDAQRNRDPANYKRDGDEMKWEPGSNVYKKILQLRCALDGARVPMEDWDKYSIVHTTANPDGANDAERAGCFMHCGICGTNFNCWDSKKQVSGTWESEDFVGAFNFGQINDHLGVCDVTGKPCPCQCGHTIQTLTQRLGRKDKATNHVMKAWPWVTKAEEFKATFGNMEVPKTKGKSNDEGVTWSKKDCNQLNRKLFNTVKSGRDWITRDQRDRLIAIGVPKTSNFKILEDL